MRSSRCPGGWLGDRIGPRAVLTRIVVWWSAFTMATGLAVGILVARRRSGSCSASAKPAPFPNLTKAFGNWFTGEDRTRAQSIMWLAARWGGAFTPLVVVVTLDFMTWRHSFFLFGAVGFVWALFFYRWFRNTPAEHPGVNPAERAQLASPEEASAGGHGHVNPPWTPILASRSVWLLSLQYACLSYGFWFYLTWMPTYIREQFGMTQADRYQAAALAALPLFLAGISVWLTGKVTPWLVAASAASRGCGGDWAPPGAASRA